MTQHYVNGSASAEWLREYDAMREDDPFVSPAPKGKPPYWIRPRDESAEAKHRRLLQYMERAHASRD